LKLLQEKAGNTLEAIGIGKDFLNRTPVAQQLRERMGKWDYRKLQSFYTIKEMVSKLKRPLQSGRKHLPVLHQTRD
jgi:mitochondrial fission protein ELM1